MDRTGKNRKRRQAFCRIDSFYRNFDEDLVRVTHNGFAALDTIYNEKEVCIIPPAPPIIVKMMSGPQDTNNCISEEVIQVSDSSDDS